MSHLNVALEMVRAGLCVLPARTDSKRPALQSWKAYQDRLPTESEVRNWFTEGRPMCIVTGEVSGQLEMIDFDAGGESFERWSELVQEEIPEAFARLVIERTPSGGRHVVYRCEGISANLKLAQRRIVVPNASPMLLYGKSYVPRQIGDEFEVTLTLIETRGEGGLFLCDPSPRYELVQNGFLNVPMISGADRETLLRAAWSLDELPPVALPDLPPGDPCGRPGDDFNDRGDIRQLLERHGWACVQRGENEYWRRPGKGNGWSATLKAGVFYVFSANAAPFEPNRGYSKFAVLACLEYGGDFRATASALRAQGYGQQAVSDPGVDLSKITKPAVEKSSQVIARRVCDVEREQLRWLWPGRIPLGKLTLLAGDPGLGKSLVTLDIAARVSRGMPWPDCPLVPQPAGEVVLFNAEDDLGDTITHRLDKAQADDTKVIAIEGIQVYGSGDKPARFYFSLEHHLPQLEQALLEWPDVRLIIVDPISAYCGETDSHNNAEVRALLAPLADLAGRTKAAILAVTHLSKSGGPKAVYRAMGSLAFAAASRAVWAITKDPNEPARRLFLPAKLNLAVDPHGLAYRIVDGRVVWEPEPVKMHADDAMRAELEGPTQSEKPTQRDEAGNWLREFLADGAKPSKEVSEHGQQAGFTVITLRRAFKAMGGKPIKGDFAGGWQWSLPSQGDQQGDQPPLTVLDDHLREE